MAIALVSLYAGMSASFGVTKVSRENLRATQIMLERMEGIRLFTYDQLTNTALCPSTFTTGYYPVAIPGESTGITYTASVTIGDASLNPPATYSDSMRSITITVFWTNYYGSPMTNEIVRSRSMTTYAARNGIQNYVFNN